MDFSVILLSLLFTAMLYIPIPIVISSIIYNKNGTVKYKRVVVFSTIFVFLVLMLWHLFTDKQPPNVTAAVVWGAISMAICKKIFGKKPDSVESTINLENQQQSVISSPSQEIEAEKQQEANCSYPCKSEDAFSGALHSERVDGVLKRTEEAWASLTPAERELLCKVIGTSQAAPPHKAEQQSKSLKPWVIGVLCGILFAAVVFFAVSVLNKTSGAVSTAHFPDATPSPSPAPSPSPEVFSFPLNGTFYNYANAYVSCPLSIKIPSDSNQQYYYFVLKSPKGKAVTIFGHSGKTVSISVPEGFYTLYYAAGNTWYGTSLMFGDDGVYYACDQTLIFHFDGSRYNGYEIDLLSGFQGNLSLHEVSADDFPE